MGMRQRAGRCVQSLFAPDFLKGDFYMNEAVKAIIERSSCNKYKPEHLKKEEIQLIVKAGLNAPSGMNRQCQRLVVVQNDAMVKKLSAMNAAVMGMDGDPFYGAPDVIIVLADKSSGTYLYDGSLAMGNMLNAAYAMGLGARRIHRAKEMYASQEGKALLKEWGLEGDLEGIGCCIAGYPDMPMETKEKVPDRVVYVD